MKKDSKRDIMKSFNVYSRLQSEEDEQLIQINQKNTTMTKHGLLKQIISSRGTLEAVDRGLRKQIEDEKIWLPKVENKENNKQKCLSETDRNISCITLIDREREHLKTERHKLPSEKLLQKLINEKNIPFDRKNKNMFKVKKAPILNQSCSQYALKINKSYDPAKRVGTDGNYTKWDTSKSQLLEYLNSNRTKFKNNDSLLYNIDAINQTTTLNRKFPDLKSYAERPHKYIPNDAHIKETAPGYTRNNAGKPYFL